jgi:hypothetical protein
MARKPKGPSELANTGWEKHTGNGKTGRRGPNRGARRDGKAFIRAILRELGR